MAPKAVKTVRVVMVQSPQHDPVYLRGEANLMLHDGNAAAAEFQKVIDHRGIVGNFPLGALARIGLARAYAMHGALPKRVAAYQDFCALERRRSECPHPETSESRVRDCSNYRVQG